MSDVRLPCDCGEPDCPGYSLNDLGAHPFFVPFDKSRYDPKMKPVPYNPSRTPIGIVRTSSWDFGGERTDLHDLFAVMWGAYLRASDIANVRLFSERNDLYALPSEIKARAVIPDDWGSYYKAWENEELKLLLAKTSIHIRRFIWDIFERAERDKFLSERKVDERPPWLSAVKEISEMHNDVSYELQTRDWPLWTCFTEIESGLTVAEISDASAVRMKKLLSGFNPETYNSVTRIAMKSEELRNAISYSVQEKLHAISNVIDGYVPKELLVIPMSSHVMAVGRRSLICIADDCGRPAYNDEILIVEKKRQNEAAFFLTDIRFVWAENISDSRFEEMIGELVKAERGVFRVRQVGSTRESDDGRDFIAEWMTPSTTSLMKGPERSLSTSINEVNDVLVQVKMRKRGVGR